MRTSLLALLFVTACATAQQVGQNGPISNSGQVTFSTATQLVIETVSVKDRGGRPVQGLAAKDFTVTENGAVQTIRFFQHETFPEAQFPEVSSKPENIHIYDKLTRVHVTPEAPGSNRYKDHRLVALYFDMTAMPPSDQARALDAAEKFVRTQITCVDLLAIMRYAGGSVDVLQDFTNDRDRLLSILQTMVVGEDQGYDESANDASSADTGAAFGQDDSEFN